MTTPVNCSITMNAVDVKQRSLPFSLHAAITWCMLTAAFTGHMLTHALLSILAHGHGLWNGNGWHGLPCRPTFNVYLFSASINKLCSNSWVQHNSIVLPPVAGCSLSNARICSSNDHIYPISANFTGWAVQFAQSGWRLSRGSHNSGIGFSCPHPFKGYFPALFTPSLPLLFKL